jgi:L-amino acid N-acyltransferase YncA
MSVTFEPLAESHGHAVMEIFNDYVKTSFSAYPEETLPESFFDQILAMTRGYPAYALLEGDRVIGFCFLRPYNPFTTFTECAEISYFLDKLHTGQGIGTIALDKIETEARALGIRSILASISSENPGSIRFHQSRGFNECGRFRKIGKKKGRYFDVVWMQKELS